LSIARRCWLCAREVDTPRGGASFQMRG
jgi:hypothetical protein